MVRPHAFWQQNNVEERSGEHMGERPSSHGLRSFWKNRNSAWVTGGPRIVVGELRDTVTEFISRRV